MLSEAQFPFLADKGHVVSLVGGGGKTTLLYQLSAHCARKGWRVLAATTTHIRQPDHNMAHTEAECSALWAAGEYAVLGTPDGCAFEGQAERVVCRAIDGDLAILAKHGDYCTALGMGEAHIVDAEGQRRRAACMGGMLTVLDGTVRLVATTWEWAEEIDQARAEASKKRAEELLAQKNLDKRDYELAQARLKRALVRTSIHP